MNDRNGFIFSMAIVALIAVLSYLVGTPGIQRTVVEMFISVALIVGIYVFVGNSGILSFGHIGFMSIGAYVAAWLTMSPALKDGVLTGLPAFVIDAELSGPAGLACAALAAIGVALVAGAVLMRLSGVAAAIASFAFLAILYTIALNWTDGTGGTSSLIGIPGFANLGSASLLALGAICVARFYDRSSWGLMMRAVREEPVAAVAAGIVPSRVRLVAFVVSAGIVAVAGGMHASYLGVVTPDTYYIDTTFSTLSMLVIGGLYCLEGAVVGTIVVTIARQLLIALERGVSIGSLSLSIPNGSQEFVVAILTCIVLVYRPAGVSGWLHGAFARMSGRKDVALDTSPNSKSGQV